MLGNSATAHFHIPPQWLTADGWNLDQLLPDAEDEIDTEDEIDVQHELPGMSMPSTALTSTLEFQEWRMDRLFQSTPSSEIDIAAIITVSRILGSMEQE